MSSFGLLLSLVQLVGLTFSLVGRNMAFKPKPKKKKRAVFITPYANPTSAGFAAIGRF